MTYNTISDAQTIAGNSTGTVLAGRYRIIRQLGQGGMGNVWLAEDAQLDGKPFAIKMLPSIQMSNKRAYRQLKDEALVAMRLVHPNIVQIRAFEENNGNPFLVMDYIEGQTLDDYLAEHCVATYPLSEASAAGGSMRGAPSPSSLAGLPESDVVRILKPIAAALDYAHGEGVVHRDVKPANVMIRKDGHPYILDFGIAREIQETMTRVTGKLSSGTLLYMSPEQLDGDTPKKEQDVYSFAAMAYECLNGDPPFVRGAIEDQIRNKRPEPLRSDGALAVGIMAGLAKKPEDRPPTCTAVLEGDGFSRAEEAGTRVPRDRDGKAASPRSPARNIRIAIPATYIAAALFIIGGVLWHRETQRQENARRLTVEQQQAESRRRQAEDERKAQEAAARKKAEDERLAKLQQEDAQRKAKEEAERKAKEEAARIEAEHKAKEEKATAERKAREIAEREAKEEAERKAKEEDARIEAEHKAKEEKAAAEQKAREIAEREAEEKRIATEARAYTNYLEKIYAIRRDASNEYAKVATILKDQEGFEVPVNKIEVAWAKIVESDDIVVSLPDEYRSFNIQTVQEKLKGLEVSFRELRCLVNEVVIQLPDRDSAREKRRRASLILEELEKILAEVEEQHGFMGEFSADKNLFASADESFNAGKFDAAARDFETATNALGMLTDEIKSKLCEVHVVAYIDSQSNGDRKWVSPEEFTASIGEVCFKRFVNAQLGVDELVLRSLSADGSIFTLKMTHHGEDDKSYRATVPIQRAVGVHRIEIELK